MLMLDESLDATAIYAEPRDAVVATIKKPGSKVRNERGALPASKFRKIGKCIWTREDGETAKRGRRTG